MLDKLPMAWVSKIFALCLLKDGARFRAISQKFKTIAELPMSSPFIVELGVKRRYQWNRHAKDTNNSKDTQGVPAFSNLSNLSYYLLDAAGGHPPQSVWEKRMLWTRQVHCNSNSQLTDDGKPITLPPHLTDLSVTFADADDYIANSSSWILRLLQLLQLVPDDIAPVDSVDEVDCEHKEKKQKIDNISNVASFNSMLTTLKMQSIQSTASTATGPSTKGEWKWDILEHFRALTSLSVASFDLNISAHYLPPTLTELEIPWYNSPILPEAWVSLKKLPIRRLSLDPTPRVYNRVPYGVSRAINRKMLSNFASHLPHLEDFHSQWLLLSDAYNLQNAADKPIHFPKLQQLSTSGTDILSLKEMLKANGQHLSRLQIANCNLRPGVLFLNELSFLSPCTQLTHLAIRNSSVETAPDPYCCPELTPLQNAQNALNPRSITLLSTLVSYFAKLGPQLTTLDLKNNRIGFTSEFSALSNLTSLSLSHTYLDMGQSNLVLPLLPRLLHLSTLYSSASLSERFLTGEFWNYLPSLQSWTMLRLSQTGNDYNYQVPSSSSSSLTPSLLHFKLKCWEPATYLCSVIKNHPRLRSLKLPSDLYVCDDSAARVKRSYPVSQELFDLANTRGVELLGRHHIAAEQMHQSQV